MMGTQWPGTRLVRLALLALVMTAGVCACLRTPDPTWERVQETQILRVGMDASFPPFETIAADGSLVGFDVDLAREIGQRLDVEPRFVANLPYDGLYGALTARRVDVVISALVVNPSRTADFSYSRVYFDAGPVLVVRRGTSTIRSPADLEDHTLAVVLGTPADRKAREWARRSGVLTTIQHSTPDEALQSLRDGESDAVLVDHVSALKAAADGDTLTIVGQPVVEVPYAVGLRDDSHRLLAEVNRALADIEQDGTLERLVTKWLKG